jgi:hypothetical protein
MDTEELKALTVRLAAVAERLDQRSVAAVQQVEQAAGMLERGAQQLSASTGGFTREVAQSLRQQAGEIVGGGIAPAVGAFDQQIKAAAKSAANAARGLEAEVLALRRERRTWAWMGSGAMLLGGALAVGASLFAVTESRRQLEQHRVEAALLQAYNRADVTLCDGALCANVDDTAPRRGERKQYQPVRPRATP